MARATLPIPKLVSKAAACEHLGICPRSFERHWQAVFTDGRDECARGPGSDRKVYEDELRAAVDAGGGVLSAAKAAVYRVRKLMGRT